MERSKVFWSVKISRLKYVLSTLLHLQPLSVLGYFSRVLLLLYLLIYDQVVVPLYALICL